MPMAAPPQPKPSGTQNCVVGYGKVGLGLLEVAWGCMKKILV